jgi:hypothetical protein
LFFKPAITEYFDGVMIEDDVRAINVTHQCRQINSAKKQQHTVITVATLYSIFVTINNNKQTVAPGD